MEASAPAGSAPPFENGAASAEPALLAQSKPVPPTAQPEAGPIPTFGVLEEVRIRDYWKDEARDFTPWLAEEANLSLLGDTIGGSSLVLVGVEQNVGPYKADIVAKDDSDSLVVIENQLDATDHRHLGQLLVYAANKEARTVVWVAKQVTEEHRKVIDWLNLETSTRFWALEIELWQIAGSPVAPKFNVVSEPNELTQSTEAGDAGLSDKRIIQLEFWTAFSDYLDESGSSYNSRKARPRNWYDLSIGTSRAHVSLTLRNDEVGCELYIPNSESTIIFAALQEDKAAIEAELGPLNWQPLPDKVACRLAVKRDGDFQDREQWDDLFDWMRTSAEKFKTTLAERVKVVDIPIEPVAPPTPLVD